jgi:hypothetical protein
MLQAKPGDIIKASVDVKSDGYEKTLEGYKESEVWGDWSFPIGSAVASSVKDVKNYKVSNISDLNLNTAWVPKGNGLGESITFTFHFPKNAGYAGPYQFRGICTVFNGYCKSMKLWVQNSRVKELKAYYDGNFLCDVELLDTWHVQTFDISKFFKNRRYGKYLNAKYEVKNGGKLQFVITAVYEGAKYKDLAISEFLCDGAGN